MPQKPDQDILALPVHVPFCCRLVIVQGTAKSEPHRLAHRQRRRTIRMSIGVRQSHRGKA